jgi:hypothetical protein
MKHVPLHRLEAAIIRPGFEAKLEPLLRYKGNQSLGRVHRLWNLFVSGLEHEATAADITQRLVGNLDYSKLCGPEKIVQASSLYGFAGRLLDNPAVLGEVPHLKEYIEWVIPPYKIFHLAKIAAPPEGFAEAAKGKSVGWAMEEYRHDYRLVRRWFDECGIAPVHGGLIPIPEKWHSIAPRQNNLEMARRFGVSCGVVARWRNETGVVCRAPRRQSVPAGSLIYPFVIHDGGKPEHDLLRKVNAAVPKHFDPETRADICQDLVVGILCGDFDVNDLSLPSKEMTRKVIRMFPTKYGPLSLDAVIDGTDGLTLMDSLTEENSLWARL